MTKKAANGISVFLVGPMGAGKTTIGRQLSKSLRYDFVDSDHEIESRTGAAIPLIFEIEGEAGFRSRERATIDELTRRRNIVLATGGGAVLSEENRRCLSERGIVIYLTASPEALFQRTGKDRNRPLLQTEDPEARLRELLEQRDPLYRDVADIVLDTGGDAVRTVVRTLVQLVGRVSRNKKIVPPADAEQRDELKPL